jgi:hypothetical protein
MLKRFIAAAALFLAGGLGLAQTDAPVVLPQDDSAAAAATPQVDKRIFGVLPNYRTTENSLPFQPISARRKMAIAFKDSFDWPAYVVGGLFAALYQLDNSNPSFGQGMAGYAKRWASGYGDQMIGNMFQEGIIPAVFHQDPRYFRLGEGNKWHRAGYALSAVMVARMDTGHRTFNFSEWGGAAASVAISNAYYADSRDASDNVQKLLTAVATDAFSNVAKEFWPDIKHYFQHRRERKEQRALGQ